MASPAPLSYEEQQDAIELALRARLGEHASLIETWPDHVIAGVGEGQYHTAPITVDDDGRPVLGELSALPVEDGGDPDAEPDPSLADIALMYSVAGMPFQGGKAPPAYILRLPMPQQRQFCEIFNAAYTRAKQQGKSDGEAEAAAFAQANGVAGPNRRGAGVAADDLTLAETTSRPWDGSAARFTDADAYCRAALVDLNPPGGPKTAARCHLPVYEPSGELNLNALRAAASAVAGGRTGTPPPYAAQAKAKIAALERQYKIGEYAAADAEPVPLDWYAQVQGSHTVAIRLDDGSGTLPAWQVYHVIGKWSVPHGVSGPITFTKAMGDSIIRNFKAGVLRRRVPLDERHKTLTDGFEVVEQNGLALGWAEDYRWGREGEGLPGAPEPSGTGPILYVKYAYTPLGSERLVRDRAYLYGSPHYSLNYVDKQTGSEYGPTALAHAATNDPFIRNQRTLLGEPAMPWVDPAQIAASDVIVLTDGLRPYQEAPMTAPQQPTEQQQQEVALAERLASVERQLAAERAAREASDARVSARERELYLADVNAFVDGLERQGVPPGALHTFRRLLRRLKHDAPPVISLADDEAAAPDLTFAAALREAMADLPAVTLGTHTYVTDTRPEDRTALSEREQVYASQMEAGRQLAREARARLGQPPLTQPVGANGNGNHA